MTSPVSPEKQQDGLPGQTTRGGSIESISGSSTLGKTKETAVSVIIPVVEKEGEDQATAKYGITLAELVEIKTLAATYTDNEIRQRIVEVLKVHQHDPNFPHEVLNQFGTYLHDPDVATNPEKHSALIEHVRIEVVLITTNSPYAQVRAVVENTDDATTSSSTVRVWCIGLFFAALTALINQLFSIRQPAVHISGHVAQLLAYPLGCAAARYLPDRSFRVLGKRHSLNPGPFSKKEHILITLMASVGGVPPYTKNIVWTQFLPQYFNQSYAGNVGYQLLIAASTNFIGYGLAGLCRRFLVYPTYCVWPQSLVTIALSSALHDGEGANEPVPAPGRRRMTMTRWHFFLLIFSAMAAYYWIPNFLFVGMSIFSWMSWISPDNVTLNSVVGFNNGVGFNPLPTFDWNNILQGGTDPLVLPIFATLNKFAGSLVSAFVVLALWYSNAWNTAYLPLNSNRVYDHFGHLYNITRAIDRQGLFSPARYEKYSPPFYSSGQLVELMASFAMYAATFTCAVLYHRHEIKRGLLELGASLGRLFRPKNERTRMRYADVHNRLMAAYQDVPESWFLAVLVLSFACGVWGILAWPTGTSPIVVLYGLLLCLVFVVPIGIIRAMTGIEVGLGVLAEFVGGAIVPGNALAMNFVKAYGFVTCSHAIWFSHDLKLAHYVKIPPRQTFCVQMVATLASTLVCTGVLNYQMRQIPDVCTPDAPFRFTCPQVNSFVSAAVFWGTLGPRKMFGPGHIYNLALLSFPFGVLVTLALWCVQRRHRPEQNNGLGWLRQAHPVVLLAGASHWAPYNTGYIWPAVPIAWLSWIWLRRRYLKLWSRYNYVLSAALSSAIGITAFVIFFTLQIPGVKLRWWGNSVVYEGCEAQSAPCRLLYLVAGDYFGPRIGEFN